MSKVLVQVRMIMMFEFIWNFIEKIVYYYIVVCKFDFIYFFINVDYFYIDFDVLFYIYVGFKIFN